jgi:hypothetical protein
MPTYTPDIKMYYGPIENENRLIPAPEISISINYNYSNDTIIGYSYIIDLAGVATGLDLRELSYGDTYESSDNYGLGAVTDHINKLRQILSQNGNMLQIVDGQTNSIILQARGGILRSFSFEESENNWYHFANYSASLEFNSVDFMSSTESCGDVFLDPASFPNGSAGIADINKFKIKEFSDSWSFNFNDSESYNRAIFTEDNNNLNINNVSFNIEYLINAKGKHFYIDENNSPLLPAWEQAKNFVQYRLYNQVTNLLNNVLKNTYTNGCTSSDGLSSINVPGSSSGGLLSSLGDSNYTIYNETITCESSESDGSFSATYSAVVSTNSGNSNWSSPATTHKITKSVNSTSDANGIVTKTISLNGTIQGLVEGGIIKAAGPIQLPSKGAITIQPFSTNTKYDNAKLVLDKIYDPSDYSAGIGPTGKRDFKKIFKDILGINLAALNIDPASYAEADDDRADPPHPSSFNLTHDYNNGTINYSIEYNGNSTCGIKYQQVSIQVNNPNKVIATFNVPNSEEGPVIQELGTFTAKTVSVTIQGLDLSPTGKPQNINISSLVQCNNISLPTTGSESILTQSQYTSNPLDGSYTITLGYICDTGCDL